MNQLVSVVVPNYNCEEYLDKCLEHIVNQTYPNWECIVCDNGSSDRSVEIIQKWAAKDSRIRVLINEVNQGLINCYNRMFFDAKGDFIMIQDADDWCDVTRIEKQLAVFAKHNVGLCLTNSVFYSPLASPDYQKKTGSGLIVASSDEVWAPATIMFKREILEHIPGFHKYFDRLTSYDRYLILEILDMYGGYYLDEYLYYVWARPNSDHRSIDLTEPRALLKILSHDIYKILKEQRIKTGTDLLKSKDEKGMKALEEKMLNDKQYLADKLRMYACIQIDHGNFADGQYLLLEAIKTAPFFVKNYQSLLYLLRNKFKGSKHTANLFAIAAQSSVALLSEVETCSAL